MKELIELIGWAWGFRKMENCQKERKSAFAVIANDLLMSQLRSSYARIHQAKRNKELLFASWIVERLHQIQFPCELRPKLMFNLLLSSLCIDFPSHLSQECCGGKVFMINIRLGFVSSSSTRTLHLKASLWGWDEGEVIALRMNVNDTVLAPGINCFEN